MRKWCKPKRSPAATDGKDVKLTQWKEVRSIVVIEEHMKGENPRRAIKVHNQAISRRRWMSPRMWGSLRKLWRSQEAARVRKAVATLQIVIHILLPQASCWEEIVPGFQRKYLNSFF